MSRVNGSGFGLGGSGLGSGRNGDLGRSSRGVGSFLGSLAATGLAGRSGDLSSRFVGFGGAFGFFFLAWIFAFRTFSTLLCPVFCDGHRGSGCGEVRVRR